MKLGLLVALVSVFASCASEKTVTQSKKRSGLDKYNNGYDLKKGEHGMMQSSSTRVSQYNSKNRNIGARDFSGKDYNKESYRKERWGGNKGFARKSFGGNTDGSKFKHSPHYVNRDVRAQANGQYATDNKSRFNTGRFSGSGNRAQEGKTNTVNTGSSGYVTSRNKNKPDPLIMSREEYNELSVSDTKRMLGR